MSSFSLSYEQITEDLAAIEESGIDTSILAQLVKQSGVPQSGDEKGAFYSSQQDYYCLLGS